jgi:hypothetical protein
MKEMKLWWCILIYQKKSKISSKGMLKRSIGFCSEISSECLLESSGHIWNPHGIDPTPSAV